MTLSFAALKVITQTLGVANYGVYSVAIAFTGTFALLADFGVNAVTSRDVAKRPNDANTIVPLSIGLRLALSATVAPLIFLASLVAYPTGPAALHIGVALIAGTFVSDAVRTVIFGYLTAKGRNYWVATATVLQQTIFLTLACCTLAWNAGIVGVFSSFMLASFLTTTACVAIVRRSVRIRPRVSLRAWRKLLVSATSIGIIQIVNLLYLRIDGILLSVLVGPAAVALYTVAYSIINGASVVPGFLMSSLLPNIVSESRRGRELLIGRALAILAFLGSLISATILLGSRDIVVLISSEQFASAAEPLSILGVALLFTFTNPAIGFSAAVLNVHHRIVWISIASLLLNVALNMALIPALGSAGAASATLLCEAMSFVAIFFSFRRQTGLRVPLLATAVRSAAMIGLALLASVLLLPLLPPLTELVHLLLVGAVAAASGGFILMIERARTGMRARYER